MGFLGTRVLLSVCWGWGPLPIQILTLSAQIGNDQSAPGTRGRRACSLEIRFAVCPLDSGGGLGPVPLGMDLFL